MASNLKRVPVKYIRDKAKSAYCKEDHCFVCGTDSDLELHHLLGLSLLYAKWCNDNSFDPMNVLDLRDQFILEHDDELYNQVYTLCNTHHVKLHKIYGVSPPLHTGPKQKRWLQKQQDKFK